MIGIFSVYGTSILRISALIGWVLLLKKQNYKRVNKISIQNFIVFLGIFIMWNLSMILIRIFNGRTNSAYLIFWAIASIFELYYVLKILFMILSDTEKHKDIFYITMTVLAIPSTLAAILSFVQKSYSPINTTDFFNIILLLLGTMIILRKLLASDMFINNIESFFIFSGFALYFCLHILASNVISLGFLENWNFGQYATTISLIYWLGSVFFIWKIRSKHSS